MENHTVKTLLFTLIIKRILKNHTVIFFNGNHIVFFENHTMITLLSTLTTKQEGIPFSKSHNKIAFFKCKNLRFSTIGTQRCLGYAVRAGPQCGRFEHWWSWGWCSDNSWRYWPTRSVFIRIWKIIFKIKHFQAVKNYKK